MSLPTTYKYYGGGGIKAGLSADQPYLTLNNKNITIYSGSMHYFRVHPEYWRDRLRKMRAAGLNTVTTYVPWNLHEFDENRYDLGHGGSDFEQFLDIQNFLTIAQEEDLLAIVRPGPYIGGNWEFGGLPSWLLRNKDIKLRTNDEVFMTHFTKGGPIIAFQIENAYGSVGKQDFPYLEGIRKILLDNGVKELLLTCDRAGKGNIGQIPGVLYTANFISNTQKQLNMTHTSQSDKPTMVMEFGSDWLDHWTEKHHTTPDTRLMTTLVNILNYPASVNFFMFHGGTNFGFMNGANVNNDFPDNSGFQPITNSYDCDAPLNEYGEYTKKYFSIRTILSLHANRKIRIPDIPPLMIKRNAYPKLTITKELAFEDLLKSMEKLNMKFQLTEVQPMELIPMRSGQHYGYIVYRKNSLDIPAYSKIKILGHVTDTLMVLVNGELLSPLLNNAADLHKFGYWKAKDQSLVIQKKCTNCTLDVIVENWGRVNYGGLYVFHQFKGLQKGQLLFNDAQLQGFSVYPLEFRTQFNGQYETWHHYKWRKTTGPKMYKAILKLDTELKYDTFIDMRGWGKGIIIVNNFVLSRYCKLGPQQTVYLPAPFLKKGDNVIMIFEHFNAGDGIKFSQSPIYSTS